jgi:hypothetical protein
MSLSPKIGLKELDHPFQNIMIIAAFYWPLFRSALMIRTIARSIVAQLIFKVLISQQLPNIYSHDSFQRKINSTFASRQYMTLRIKMKTWRLKGLEQLCIPEPCASS